MSHRRARTCVTNVAARFASLGACMPGAITDSPPLVTTSLGTSDSRTASANPSTTVQTTPTSEPGLDGTRSINVDSWMPNVEGLSPVRSDDLAKALALTGIPAASHESLKHMAFEFSGEDIPEVWRGAWVDDAFGQGRGLPIQAEGGAVLELIINGTPMTAFGNHYPGGAHTHIGDPDVVSDDTFEDNTHVVIGVPAARQFQIGFLSDPVCTVIDICN